MDLPQVRLAVSRRTGHDPAVVASVLHALQSVVGEQLLHGCPVRLSGLVTFSPAGRAVRVRPGRQLCRLVERHGR